MRRWPLALAGVASWLAVSAGASAGDGWSLGYGAIPLEFRYPVVNYLVSPAVIRQGEDRFLLGTLELRHEHRRRFGSRFVASLRTGIGIPVVRARHEGPDETSYGVEVENLELLRVGDYMLFSAWTIPVLFGGRFERDFGAHVVGLGVGAGGMVVGIMWRDVNTGYAGSPPFQVPDFILTREDSEVRSTWVALGRASYHLRLGSGHAIGVVAHVGWMGTAEFDRSGFEPYRWDELRPESTDLTPRFHGGRLGGLTGSLELEWVDTF